MSKKLEALASETGIRFHEIRFSRGPAGQSRVQMRLKTSKGSRIVKAEGKTPEEALDNACDQVVEVQNGRG